MKNTKIFNKISFCHTDNDKYHFIVITCSGNIVHFHGTSLEAEKFFEENFCHDSFMVCLLNDSHGFYFDEKRFTLDQLREKFCTFVLNDEKKDFKK